MSEKPGFLIYKKHYPAPETFRLEDPVLVRAVTGMEWPEFTLALEEMDVGDDVDHVVLAGLVAVAFWQGNPQMRREKVERLMEKLSLEDVEMVGDELEDDAGPPEQAGETFGLPMTASASSQAEPISMTGGSVSDGTPPNGSGDPGSPTISPVSSPA